MLNRMLKSGCALAVLSMLAGTAPAAPQTEGMAVVRDADTGQLRAATGAEIRALQGPQQRRQSLSPQAKPTVRADGTRSALVGERGMVYSTVTRAADGTLVQRCAEGETAAAHATHQNASVPQNKEQANER